MLLIHVSSDTLHDIQNGVHSIITPWKGPRIMHSQTTAPDCIFQLRPHLLSVDIRLVRVAVRLEEQIQALNVTLNGNATKRWIGVGVVYSSRKGEKSVTQRWRPSAWTSCPSRLASRKTACAPKWLAWGSLGFWSTRSGRWGRPWPTRSFQKSLAYPVRNKTMR